MKSIRSIAAVLFFAVLFSISAFAQTGATTAGGAKVAVVDTSAFADDKAGITKFNTALKSLDTEFQPRRTELQNMTNQFNTLVKDLDTLSKSTAPVAPPTIQAKRDQAENLQKDIKRKQEDAQAAFTKRQEQVLGPIYNDIGKAISDYAKQKGYTMIFDLSKDQNQMLIYADLASTDITVDFIKFYNARPAGTASTATPK
jgi:Skp family chaperone for outer membrane proteins